MASSQSSKLVVTPQKTAEDMKAQPYKSLMLACYNAQEAYSVWIKERKQKKWGSFGVGILTRHDDSKAKECSSSYHAFTKTKEHWNYYLESFLNNLVPTLKKTKNSDHAFTTFLLNELKKQAYHELVILLSLDLKDVDYHKKEFSPKRKELLNALIIGLCGFLQKEFKAQINPKNFKPVQTQRLPNYFIRMGNDVMVRCLLPNLGLPFLFNKNLPPHLDNSQIRKEAKQLVVFAQINKACSKAFNINGVNVFKKFQETHAAFAYRRIRDTVITQPGELKNVCQEIFSLAFKFYGKTISNFIEITNCEIKNGYLTIKFVNKSTIYDVYFLRNIIDKKFPKTNPIGAITNGTVPILSFSTLTLNWEAVQRDVLAVVYGYPYTYPASPEPVRPRRDTGDWEYERPRIATK